MAFHALSLSTFIYSDATFTYTTTSVDKIDFNIVEAKFFNSTEPKQTIDILRILMYTISSLKKKRHRSYDYFQFVWSALLRDYILIN